MLAGTRSTIRARFRAASFGTAAALVALICASSCSDLTFESADGKTTISGDLQLSHAEAEASTQLLDKILRARSHVAFSGTRLVLTRVAGSAASGPTAGTAGTDEILREYYVTSGDGKFRIEPLELLEPQIDAGRSQEYLMAQARRQGLMFRYRDFQIRARQSFLQNYQVTDTGEVVTEHDRRCARWEIRPRGEGELQRILIDLATGVVLRYERLDASGRTVHSMWYESVQFGPVSPNVRFHEPAVEERVFADVATAERELGFPSHAPRKLPENFRLCEVAAVTDPLTGRVWLKRTYTDGLDCLLLLEGDPAKRSVNPASAALGGKPLGAQRATILEIAPWTTVEASLGTGDFIVMSRTGEQALMDLVRSL